MTRASIPSPVLALLVTALGCGGSSDATADDPGLDSAIGDSASADGSVSVDSSVGDAIGDGARADGD
ncbi:MAG: hypothetical protein ABI175_28325, partial [Polyangiales bacterium]